MSNPPADPCPHCGGRGVRVIAAFFDAQMRRAPDGRSVMASTYTAPVPTPCICAMERAAKGVPAA